MDKVFAPKDRIRIKIEGVAFGGAGVGRIDGRVVFVPFTVDGDVVEAALKVVKKRYLLAEMQELIHASPFRIAPPCPYYMSCGGCHYQHMEYGHELKIKKQQIVDVLERIGGLSSPPVEDVVPSPKIYHYRQKAEYHCTRDTNGRIMTGFMKGEGSDIIEIERCELVEESINEEYAMVKHGKTAKIISRERMTFWSDVAYKADEYITRTVNAKSLKVPYGGFFQANGALVGQLVDAVVEACHPLEDTTIIDCYCGSGLFTLFLALRARRIFGGDADEKAVTCAKGNLEAQGFSRARFYAGKMEGVLKKIRGKSMPHIDSVILDPPRIGCAAAVLDEIAALQADRIVYVSCNPATQARDIRRLLQQGYVLDRVRPFDMFPRTKHVENIAQLRYSSPYQE